MNTQILKFTVLLFVLTGCFSSCKKSEYPIELGEQTCVGRIVSSGNPCPPSDSPCVPGIVLWLETTSDSYVLTFNSRWIWEDKIIIDNVEYSENDEVEIKGTVKVYQNMHLEEYFSIEIENIRKISD